MNSNMKYLLFLVIAVVAVSVVVLLLKKPISTAGTQSDSDFQPSTNRELSFRSMVRSDGMTILQDVATQQELPQEESALLIRDLLELEQIWSLLYPNELLPFDATELEVSDAVLIMSAQRGSGGYALTVTKVIETTLDTITIHIDETIPGDNCIVTTVMTRPFELILIPHVNAKSIVIDKTITQNSCQ